MDVRVGLCGWTVSQSSYVRRFPVVEVQNTFYDPPADAVLTRWRTQVPTDFEFTMKAWQIVTHESNSPTYRRLKEPLSESAHGQVGGFRTTPEVLAGWQRTLECSRLLRATAVLLQCPKSFRPTKENVARLRDFVSHVERPDGRLLWEPRGEWPTQLLEELCAELDLVHVVDPMQSETVTPEHTYYRLHGTTGWRHVHTGDELRRLRDMVVGRPAPYVMFNNIPRTGDAERFLDLLSGKDG
ncbi:hypothetical protein GCM10009721_43050 [Terrabacter tumescens]|uniref:DUF72 domain-containing protein n=1 Tax=Terrabacter tumescens TaxID=60443 RepID=A0ABQ2IIS1_9MICO|nr:DUF72 domain-containing protein [Terrabacter tumescens]GGN10423.1 hypothetical protein GCM10009721_43050 [Terrabacter tumescens]